MATRTATTATVARRAAWLTRTTGGATIRPADGSIPTRGYAVALPGAEESCPLPADELTTAELIGSYVDRHAETLAPSGRHLGTWVDDGTLYVDTVEIIPDRHAAELAGLAADQLAIFDLGTATEIRLTPAHA